VGGRKAGASRRTGTERHAERKSSTSGKEAAGASPAARWDALCRPMDARVKLQDVGEARRIGLETQCGRELDERIGHDHLNLAFGYLHEEPLEI